MPSRNDVGVIAQANEMYLSNQWPVIEGHPDHQTDRDPKEHGNEGRRRRDHEDAGACAAALRWAVSWCQPWASIWPAGGQSARLTQGSLASYRPSQPRDQHFSLVRLLANFSFVGLCD